MRPPIHTLSSVTPENSPIPRGSGDVAGSISYRVGTNLNPREISIEKLKASLEYVGTCAEQLGKITDLLSLTMYYKDSPEDREKYFYTAVELAQRCIEDDTIRVLYWKEIISTFLLYIRKMTPEQANDATHMQSARDHIPVASIVWNQKGIQLTADLEKSLNSKSTAEEILDRLETAFGLIRLLIISDDSGEIVAQHRIDTSEIDTLRDPSKTNIRYTIVRPFDRTRTYCVVIDRGSRESANQIAGHHWENMIQKIINTYIEKREIDFCINQHAIIDEIKSIEKEMEAVDIVSSQGNDYRSFIESVIGLMDPTISHESACDPEYIDNLLRALDICKIVTLQHSGNKHIQTQDIPQQIDHILGRRMNSRVLDMVTMLLLSRDETMNGLGYPFGVIKKDIPIEARIYSIIRLYEALCGSIPPKSISQAMQYWSRGGSLDSVVLGTFLQSLTAGKIQKKQIHTNQDSQVSPYRETLYTPFVQSWTTIMSHINEIEQQYLQYRTSGDIGEQSRLAIIIKDLQFNLIKIADLMKVVVIMLHDETPSDLIPGQPGVPGEGLTEVGKENAKKKGEILRGLFLFILSSPINRAIQSASIICNEIRNYVDRCLLSPSVINTNALENPPKHTELNRFDFLAKIFGDNSNALLELRWRIVSSPIESVEVLVTHGTVATYANFLITNLGRTVQEITGTAIPNKSGMGDVHLIQGGRRIDWNLFFPFNGWQEVIREVHAITQDIFGDTFSPIDQRDIHLIHIHKKFLDYIYLKKERFPRKIGAFINRLNKNPRTKHFSAILRKEGKIQPRKRKK